MAARRRVKSILIIGAGPNQIGLDTEIDSATLQTIKELHNAGHTIHYVSNNANSIIADLKEYVTFIVSDLNVNAIINILKEYQIDTILPTLGSGIALELVDQLEDAGILDELNIKTIGVTTTTIHNLQNPELMNRVLSHIKQPTIPTTVVDSNEAAIRFVKKVGYPVIIKPIASLTKTNRSRCENEHQMIENLESSFKVSTTHQVAVEKSIVGFKEIEMVVIRDAEGTKLLINGAENFNPVGVHAGDSIIFSPTQTLTDAEFQALRQATFRIAEIFRIKGVCHVQFALDPAGNNYFVTRINPFFDRSTAFAARATGYPVAYVVSSILLGKNLRDIEIPGLKHHESLALIEPTLDHVAVRFPTWSFASFKNAEQELNTRVKSTGAVMAFGRSMEEALQKAIRSVDSTTSAEQAALDESRLTEAQLINVLIHPRAGEIFYLLEAIRRGYTVDELAELTKVDAFYFYKLQHLVSIEQNVRKNPFDVDALKQAKYFGLGDSQLAHLWHSHSDRVRDFRINTAKCLPTYKGIEPTAGEFPFITNTYYSTFEDEDELTIDDKPKVLVLGTANNQVGTNSAAEYATVQEIKALQALNYQVVLLNNNPNAISLSFGMADKVYLEPLTIENCLNIIEREQPEHIIAQGKWEIVTRLIERGVTIHQLPLSRTTRSENVESDFMLIACKYQNQMAIYGGVKVEGHQLNSSLILNSKIKNKLNPIVTAELKKQDRNGIYTVVFKQNNEHLTVTGVVPLAIQDTPYLSCVLNRNLIADLVNISLNNFKIDEVQTQFNQLDEPLLYNHVYPYHQFGLQLPQQPPFSLANGARVETETER